MTDDVPDGDATLDEVRAWLWVRIEDGVRCPCCNQFAKIYYRHITGRVVRALVNLYNRRGNWQRLPPLDPSRGEAARMSYWNLIEERPVVREDGGRAGWWRITEKGVEWLNERIFIQEYARVYDSELLALMGSPYWVRDAVKNKFDLRKLMEGPFDE